MSVETAETNAVFSRRTVIHGDSARSIDGRDLAPGDVLATGVILEVTRNDIDGEVRLEMPGADVHFVDYDEPVTVLATVTREVLDGISLGTFVARARPRAVPPQPVEEPVVPEPTPAPQATVTPTARTGKTNPGPLGQYEEGVEHYTDICPIHGETTFAIHKAGFYTSGEQRFNRRCLACHSDYNLDRRG